MFIKKKCSNFYYTPIKKALKKHASGVVALGKKNIIENNGVSEDTIVKKNTRKKSTEESNEK